MDIKQEDLKRLWEWCGLVEQETGSWYENKVGGKYISATMLTLTLDHLNKGNYPLTSPYQSSICDTRRCLNAS